jgi:hypothetical protein
MPRATRPLVGIRVDVAGGGNYVSLISYSLAMKFQHNYCKAA